MDHSNQNISSTKPLEALEYPYQVFLISLYSFTACFAFISNLLTIVVMVKGKRCTRDLRKFLINLSVTDLLMAVFTIPFTYTNYMLGRWIFFSPMCPIVNCAQLTTITVSIYTLVAIAIDRYVAIMHPLQKSISWFKQHRTFIVIIIWILGLFLGLSQLIVSETETFMHDGQQYLSCGERWTPESLEGRLYTAFIFSTTFAMPMSALCVIYTAMGWRLLRYRGPEHEQRFHSSQTKTSINGSHDNGNVRHHNKTTQLSNKSTPSTKDSIMNEERTNSSETGTDDHHHSIGSNTNVECMAANVTRSMSLSHNHRQRPSIKSNQNDYNHSTHSVCYKSSQNRHHNQVNFNSNHTVHHQFNDDYDSQGNRIHSINQRSWKLMHIRRNKVLKMLITIIGVFTICWLPIQIFTILIYFKPNFLQVDSEFKYYAFVGSYFFCHWISMAHSFMNPIIYSFMSKNFRSDMKMLFSKLWYYCQWRKLVRRSFRSEIDGRAGNSATRLTYVDSKYGFKNSYYYQQKQKHLQQHSYQNQSNFHLNRDITIHNNKKNQQRFSIPFEPSNKNDKNNNHHSPDAKQPINSNITTTNIDDDNLVKTVLDSETEPNCETNINGDKC